MGTKERTIMLTIISVLAKEAKIDLNKHNKAARTIVDIAEREGVRLAERTVEEHLKKVPDALERRTS
jgi:hypothetical protein